MLRVLFLYIPIWLVLVNPVLLQSKTTKDTIERSLLPKHGDIGLFPKRPDSELYSFKVGGFYRFFGTMNHHHLPFIQNDGVLPDTAIPRSIFIGDDSQLPNLLLNFSGRPSDKTAWGFDLFVFQFLDGNLGSSYGGRQVKDRDRPPIHQPLSGVRLASNLGLLLGINMYGDFTTELGVWNIKTGGIHWTSISDLTLSAFTGYNRFILFERNPWDPISVRATNRYQSYYSQGNINQDTRWGERAFVGTIIEGKSLPANTQMKLLYGKTELNGGFLSIPNLSYGGQIRKNINNGFLSFNTFNNRTFIDSLNRQSIGFNMATLEAQYLWSNGIELKAEAGVGRYFSPVHMLPWGEAINLKIHFKEKKFKVPTEFHYYRVSPQVINNNAIFWNTAIVEARANDIPAGSIGSGAVLAPFASALTPIGAFTNNRHGLNINSQIKYQQFKFSAANGIGSELQAYTNTISYTHPVNQLTRSRFWRWDFPVNVGPYNRYNVLFRDVYQKVNIQGPPIIKHFNTMELQAKYHGKVLMRDFYAFLLNRYSSVQDFLSPVTVFNENAFLRHYSNELECYYSIRDYFILGVYTGYERIIGNYETEVDLRSRRPRNQEGWGLGIGVDYDLDKNTTLYLRHRWYGFEDRSFNKDRYKGTESMIELKFNF
jgi:hypothetical protein